MKKDEKLKVLDFGGSIFAPDVPDCDFLRVLLRFLKEWLEEDSARRLVMVVGGGGAARTWQNAVRELAPEASHDSIDWVGVMATRLNAELFRALLGPLCPDPVVTDLGADFAFTGRVLMAAGWKPGFSTDYDAVLLAEKFAADTIIMLSNINQIYDADPNQHPDAKALGRISWDEYRQIGESEWKPGANTPFDPVASERAQKAGLSVIAAAGRNLDNLKSILSGGKFVGTLIDGKKEMSP